MRHQEKKYRVADFGPILARLESLRAKPLESSASTHYYAQQAGRNVTKIVEHQNGVAIHILDEAAGKFTLRQNIAVDSVDAGKAWLKEHGFGKISVVTMRHTDYEYGSGIVGLYVINDWLHSVILDFPDGQHAAIERDFGLENAEVISLPYNKYLESLHRLDTVNLA